MRSKAIFVLAASIIFAVSPVSAEILYNIIDLGTLSSSYPYSEAFSINNNGQIAGYANDAAGYSRGTLFDATGGGNNIDLSGGTHSIAQSINDNGQIVGIANHAQGDFATLFDATGGGNNINLGALPGYCLYSYAYSINNNGQIVGSCYLDGGLRATLFDETGSGANIDLNTLIDPTLGWTLEFARSINDDGWIVGCGINPDGYTRAFVLTPEPSTLLLLSLGAVMARRKRS